MTDESSNLTKVASALESMFNPAIGMVYATNNTQISKVSNYPQNKTFWMENDNGQVVWALQPYDSKMSSEVNQTLQYYTNTYNVPPSDHIEVFWGLPIPTTIYTPVNYVIYKSASFVVLDEIHNTTTHERYQNYADLLIIHSLNNYLRGNETGAMADFCTALGKWDGSGLIDKADPNTGNYSDYQLAYVIYAAHVLNVWNPTLTLMEKTLWSHMLPSGHIPLKYGSAFKDGTTKTYDAETDSDVLLAYNPTLISQMQSLEGAYSGLSPTCDSRCLVDPLPAPQFPLGSILALVVPLCALGAYFGAKGRRISNNVPL
jgi:hypothetical protein